VLKGAAVACLSPNNDRADAALLSVSADTLCSLSSQLVETRNALSTTVLANASAALQADTTPQLAPQLSPYGNAAAITTGLLSVISNA
jgi:hypothetical protein